MNNYQKRQLRLRIARTKGTHTKQEWDDMCDFFDYTCVRCLGESNLAFVEKDHIIPIYLGGSDSIKNIQPLCARCNSSKGRETIDHRINYCQYNGIKMPQEWVEKEVVNG